MGAIETRAERPPTAEELEYWGVEANYTYGNIDFPYKEVKLSEVPQMMQEGWILLDVRSNDQVEKAAVKDSIRVPLYVEKNDTTPYQALVNFGFGGFWSGQTPKKENRDWLRQVSDIMEEKVSAKTAGIICVCQSGLRSKLALQQIYLAGYQSKLALVKNGYNSVKPGDKLTL